MQQTAHFNLRVYSLTSRHQRRTQTPQRVVLVVLLRVILVLLAVVTLLVLLAVVLLEQLKTACQRKGEGRMVVLLRQHQVLELQRALPGQQQQQ